MRLEDDRFHLLVLIGVTKASQKELLAAEAGHRESEESWKEALQDLKRHGLAITPKLAIDGGALVHCARNDQALANNAVGFTRLRMSWINHRRHSNSKPICNPSQAHEIIH